jgi:Holliday junction resolvasome RuvABC endonuclease subunit
MVLGCDQSYSATGLVWLNQNFTVAHQQILKFPPSDTRLLGAFKRLCMVVKDHKPTMAVVEDVAYGTPSRTTLVKLCKLLGVVEAALQANDVPYLVVSASGCRRWLTGNGHSDKLAVAKELKRRFKIGFEADPRNDLSDAALLAAWAVATKGHK